MERAVVLIGVKKAHGLPPLNAVGDGLRKMADWAESQGICGDRLVVLSDDEKAVRAHEIFDAISNLVSLGTLTQLIVYFSGHGVYNRGERWLLSGAPVSTSEAVNVEGSIQLARYCGIPHVVLISDACRTAPEGIQALQVTGTEIFPNDLTSDFEQKVDVFFACARGNAAFEVRDVNESAGRYGAIYSDALVECLRGKYGEIVEQPPDGPPGIGVIRAEKLHDQLRRIVPVRLEKLLGSISRLNQIPDARIISRAEWLSTIPIPASKAQFRGRKNPPPRSPTPSDVIEAMIRDASDHRHFQAPRDDNATFQRDPVAAEATAPGRWDIGSAVQFARFETGVRNRLRLFFQPSTLTDCGFEIVGEVLRSVHVRDGTANGIEPTRTIVQIAPDHLYSSVLLEFGSGAVTVLPAIAAMRTRLDFEDGALVDVSYEFARTRAPARDDLQTVKTAIVSAANDGQLRLSGAATEAFAAYVQASQGQDLSLALYCAYACHEAQRTDLIRELATSVVQHFGVDVFDLRLLGSDPRNLKAVDSVAAPGFPLISQGWTLLSAFRANLPAAVRELEGYLMPSHWTLFNAVARDKIKAAMARGEL
ncbi:hypothetical protein WM28_16735 [Burkholderia ubonensis]|uniref:caspase family protein n=1 Tax=Burkholderia ubonensis TaxID=101571 RepID=UPI00075FC9EF|nr:caspase family protein [Burkholderia ubonensis]KWO47694.1 hypothetical protein WM28_16735 [Burkholderia ubonensis]